MRPSFIQRRSFGPRLPLAGVVAAALMAASMVGAPVTVAAQGSTCMNSQLSSKTYRSLVVIGQCEIPNHTNVVIKGGLMIAQDSALIGASSPPNRVCDRSVKIFGGVTIEDGAMLFLGDSLAGTQCAGATTIIRGGVRGNGAGSVVIHGATITGGVRLVGGGLPICTQDLNPCYFDALEDSHVSGGVSISNYGGFWLGMARNRVNGTVRLMNNVLADTDANEILSNTIHGSIACVGNDPTPTDVAEGHIPSPNTITGRASGQCAGF